ncbi:hypothetical protein L2U69_01460 [Zavarzinia compransoris]|uniref:hypothetical protein n=1 Tax=Zavarzinia marina TaxID=2911065 RepID=UPI001F3BD3AF|nr:hypothetical protein [Zavarzinia marina]MCF4164312.1 hypothetical protein [Zavarzinia marina]
MMRRLAAVTVFPLLLMLSATGADARERLHLPAALVAAITAACPDCATRGVIACGDTDVRTGPKYLDHAFQGAPPRAYVMSWPMGDKDMRRLSETLPLDAANTAIAAAFAEMTLVAATPDHGARALPAPKTSAALPPALHACLADPDKPWGCCAAGCGEDECCEKSLGSPRIRADWQDPESAESLTLRWSRNGGTRLTRVDAEGTKTSYACLAWGPLRLD